MTLNIKLIYIINSKLYYCSYKYTLLCHHFQVAREQELLDRERTDMKTKHGDRKARSKRRHRDKESDNQPPNQMPGVLGGGIGGAMGNFSNPMANMMGMFQ